MVNQGIKVVVAVPTFKSIFHTMICEHLRKMLKPDELALRSVTGEDSVQKEHLKRALTQINPTALIAMDICPDAEIVAAYTDVQAPIVLVNEIVRGVSTISTDNLTGGRIAGDYLVKIGRKKIAIVSGRTKVHGGRNAEQRLKGFEQAMSAGRLSIPVGCRIEVENYSREDGIAVMPKLLEIGVDAIFCAAGDNCASGLLTVAKERGIRVPDDVAIVGFDDLLIAQISIPKLTTIRQPLLEIAEAAYKMAVLERVQTLHKPQNVVFNPELVIRQSA